VSFAVPMDAPGMVFLCRDSAMRPDVNPVDAPFSSRFDEQDAFCIFDDVEVPKSQVFINGDVSVYNSVMAGSPWWPNIMQQTTIRALTKLEFAYGLVVQMTDILNDRSDRAMEFLGEILGYVEMVRSTLYAAQARCETWEDGAVCLEARAIHPLRSLIPDWFVRINEIIKTLGSHNLIQVSSQLQLADPRIRRLVDEFMPCSDGRSGEDRSNLFRAAWDFTGSGLGSRNELYERNYLSSARTNRMLSQRLHSGAARQRGAELVEKLLADARSRTTT
jgi:4-hydroxyphenylacetate 3-monooxygenase